jgi:hypothetical protein
MGGPKLRRMHQVKSIDSIIDATFDEQLNQRCVVLVR